jgi:hypothetical protein
MADSRDIVVTLPKDVHWGDYKKELDAVKDGNGILRFKVWNLPGQDVLGGRCYLVWRGYVRGWMKVVGLGMGEFRCETTGKVWQGRFIERSGPFWELVKQIPMRGFQGFRYWQTPLNPPVNGWRPQ